MKYAHFYEIQKNWENECDDEYNAILNDIYI